MASNNINVGSAANDGEGQNLRDAFISVRKNFAQMFGITYTGDTQDLSGTTFSSDVITQGLTNKFLTSGSVGASELDVTGNGNVGQLLSSDGDGTMTWANAASGGYTTEFIGASQSVTAVKNIIYILANPQAVTITLPASPSDGDTIGIANNLDANGGQVGNLLVAPGTGGNTDKIMGDASDLVLDNASAAFDLVFSSAGAPNGNGWTIVGAN